MFFDEPAKEPWETKRKRIEDHFQLYVANKRASTASPFTEILKRKKTQDMFQSEIKTLGPDNNVLVFYSCLIIKEGKLCLRLKNIGKPERYGELSMPQCEIVECPGFFEYQKKFMVFPDGSYCSNNVFLLKDDKTIAVELKNPNGNSFSYNYESTFLKFKPAGKFMTLFS